MNGGDVSICRRLSLRKGDALLLGGSTGGRVGVESLLVAMVRLGLWQRLVIALRHGVVVEMAFLAISNPGGPVTTIVMSAFQVAAVAIAAVSAATPGRLVLTVLWLCSWTIANHPLVRSALLVCGFLPEGRELTQAKWTYPCSSC